MYWINIEYFNNKDRGTHLCRCNLSWYAEGLKNNNEEVSETLLYSLRSINDLLKDKNNSISNITISEEEVDITSKELKKVREWDINKTAPECDNKNETKKLSIVPSM